MKVILDGNAFYEIDEECMRQKEAEKAEEARKRRKRCRKKKHLKSIRKNRSCWLQQLLLRLMGIIHRCRIHSRCYCRNRRSKEAESESAGRSCHRRSFQIRRIRHSSTGSG